MERGSPWRSLLGVGLEGGGGVMFSLSVSNGQLSLDVNHLLSEKPPHVMLTSDQIDVAANQISFHLYTFIKSEI